MTDLEVMGCRLAIVLMVGLPGAGKTFLCRKMVDIFEKDDSIEKVRVIHVCYDDIIQNWREQRDVRKEILECVRYFCSSAYADRSPERQNIVSKKVGFGQIAVQTDVDVAVRRNALRSGGIRVDEEVIFNMAEKMQMPDASRFRWERNTLLLKRLTDDEGFLLVRSFLIQCFSEACIPSPKIEVAIGAANENSLSNNLYRCDIALRRIVAEEVTNISRGFMDQKLDANANVQTLGRELSEAKALLLKRLKQSGPFEMPAVEELKKLLFEVYQQLKLDRLSDSLGKMNPPSHSLT
ncbi:hypothetical protein TTRE_0000318501 [Trichuris trichiura]|uniref:Uncharacterized protein n=1 Tax=Trichuris trichiura TaxID=36087 RepID=A0A077Z886_TRITR|nr:hypothetical protein TTRE_0000318501 [Trichuris trichiura]